MLLHYFEMNYVCTIFSTCKVTFLYIDKLLHQPVFFLIFSVVMPEIISHFGELRNVKGFTVIVCHARLDMLTLSVKHRGRNINC